MDSKQTGSLLKDAFPLASSSVNEVMREDQVVQDSPIPSVSLVFPKAYFNRLGFRIDICGDVSENTREFHEGFRFFDHEGCFYREDGRLIEFQEDGKDLVSVIKKNALGESQVLPGSPMWVHPQHHPMKTFFQRLVPHKVELREGGHYLNRMGFVVSVVRQGTDSFEGNLIFCDEHNNSYSLSGSLRSSSSSMKDLIYEIKNWSLFSRSDWSSDQVAFAAGSSKTGPDDIPELFDPVGEDRDVVLAAFFKTILEAHTMAKKLGIEFGFHMNGGLSGLS